MKEAFATLGTLVVAAGDNVCPTTFILRVDRRAALRHTFLPSPAPPGWFGVLVLGRMCPAASCRLLCDFFVVLFAVVIAFLCGGGVLLKANTYFVCAAGPRS